MNPIDCCRHSISQEPSIAIIMLNWNGFNDSVDCLNSIRNVSYQNYKIVLVDNGSANEEGSRLKEAFPEVHLISNLINRGFAGGNNDGINWALDKGFEYILNLNNDCLVEKDWLTNLIHGIKTARADFATSRIMYYPDTDKICSDGDGLLPDGEGIVLNHLSTAPESNEIKSIFGACGACSIYSAACLEDVKVFEKQFFDELYFAYFEDVDLGIRVNAKHYKGVSVPDSVVYHKGSQSAGFRSSFQIFHLEKNRILNEILNYPIWLIPMGEFYYFVKVIVRFLKKVTFTQGSRVERSIRPKETYNVFTVMIKSRLWILLNIREIWKNRQERKHRGLINKKVFKHFYWDCPNLFKLRDYFMNWYRTSFFPR